MAYDAGDGQSAARLWWTLRWAGHPEAGVLDGGFAAWEAAGRPVEPGQALPRPGDLVVRPGSVPTLDPQQAADLARTGVLIDARVAPRYRGQTEPIDPVAGHVPGAVNLPLAELSAGKDSASAPRGGTPDRIQAAAEDGRLRPAAELRRIFAAVGVRDGVAVGAYCGSGITAARTVLALHEAGYTDAALFVGSWSEWITDPSRPVATGE